MRFKLILFSGILAFSVISNSSAQTFKAGLILGLNASQVNGDDIGGYSNPGLRTGIRASTMLKDRLQIDSDILFSQKGSRPSASEFNATGQNWKFRMDYIEVPVTLRFSDWYTDDDYYKVYAKAGLSYGRFFRSKNSPDSPFRTLDEYIRQNDLSLVVGAGFYPRKHLQCEIVYTRSLFPFYLPEFGRPWGRALLGYSFSLQIMYEI
jgi:hypothetical protein